MRFPRLVFPLVEDTRGAALGARAGFQLHPASDVKVDGGARALRAAVAVNAADAAAGKVPSSKGTLSL